MNLVTDFAKKETGFQTWQIKNKTVLINTTLCCDDL
jgi:hypothetical protein